MMDTLLAFGSVAPNGAAAFAKNDQPIPEQRNLSFQEDSSTDPTPQSAARAGVRK